MDESRDADRPRAAPAIAPDPVALYRGGDPDAVALVVTADPGLGSALARLARRCGHEIELAPDLPAARAALEGGRVSAALVDLGLAGGAGPAALREAARAVRTVALTASAAAARGPGADAVLAKPARLRELVHALFGAHGAAAPARLAARPAGALPLPPGTCATGPSAARRVLVEALRERARHRPARTLLTGPAGTDRLHVAARLHELGGAHRPGVLVRCASETEPLAARRFLGGGPWGEAPGYLERAGGGTLVLDDVSALPTPLQSLVVNAIESGRLPGGGPERRVACDLVCVLREPVGVAIGAGRLDTDLYYALAGGEIRVPSLAETPEDVVPIAESMLAALDLRAGTGAGATPGLLEALAAAAWPGNQVQLRGFLAALHARTRPGEPVGLDDEARRRLVAARDAPPGIEVGATLSATRRRWLDATLRHVDGNGTRAARLLGVSPRTIYALRKAAGSRDGDAVGR